MCMVRPVADEKHLHALSDLELDDLRPAFVEQMAKLRRKVVNPIRAK